MMIRAIRNRFVSFAMAAAVVGLSTAASAQIYGTQGMDFAAVAISTYHQSAGACGFAPIVGDAVAAVDRYWDEQTGRLWARIKEESGTASAFVENGHALLADGTVDACAAKAEIIRMGLLPALMTGNAELFAAFLALDKTLHKKGADLPHKNGSDEPPGRATNKILLGPHTGDATIATLTGVDTDKAVVTFQRQADDREEECRRYRPDDDEAEIRACASQRDENDLKIYRRRGWCERSTLYMEFGNYSLIGTEPQKSASSIAKAGPKLITTNWKNHKTGELAGNCSACGSEQLVDTFRVLCPRAYRAWFGDALPH